MSPIYGSSPEGSRLYVMANSGMSAHIRLIVTAMTIVVVSYGERETKVVELLKQLFNPFVYIFFSAILYTSLLLRVRSNTEMVVTIDKVCASLDLQIQFAVATQRI